MICKNDVLLKDGVTYRVLFVDYDKIGLYDMSNTKSGISYTVVCKDELNEQFNSGHITKEKDPYESLRDACTTNNVARMEANFEIIKPIVTSPSILYSKSECTAAINSVAGDDKVLSRKIYRLLGRWFQRGQCKGALLPDYRAVGKGTRNLTKCPGRKSGGLIPIMNDALRSLMARVIKKYVLVENHLSLQRAYSELLRAYMEAYPDSQVLPSMGQFRGFYYRTTTRRDRNINQNSKRIFNKDIQAKMGSVYEASSFIGSVYEVDATVDNVYLISSGSSPRAVGRPVLYLVTDRFSGMIAGFSVSLENAQYRSAAEAIYCAIAEKTKYFKESFDIDLPFEWDVSGIPEAICADNAELEGVQIEHFLRYCNVTITNTAPYRADQKGSVENSIHLVQKELASFLVKQSFTSNLSKKAGGQDNRANAVLTLQDYRAMILYAIDTINHRVRRNMPANYPPELPCTPIALWKWAKSLKTSALCNCANEDALRLSLMHKQAATVSREGVKCSKIVYTCKELENDGYFDRDGNSKKIYKPALAIDHGNVANAWIYPDPINHPEKYLRCRLASHSSYLAGCCMYEANMILEIKSASLKHAKMDQDLLRCDNRERLEDIWESAKRRLDKCASILSEKAQKDLIKESRFNEKIKDACARSLSNKTGPKQEIADNSSDTESHNDYDLPWGYADRFTHNI